MSAYEHFEKQIGETGDRITTLGRHLERLGSLEQSLDGAGRGLGEASANIGNLAASTRITMDSLDSALKSFRQAAETLQRADPARPNEMIAGVETQVEGVSSRIARFESDSREFRDRLLSEMANAARQLSEESQNMRNAITAATETATKETNKVIENVAAHLASRQQESMSAIKLLAYLTLISVLLLAGLQIYSFISA